MEIIHQNTAKRTDTSLLVITHLTQFLTYITGFGGLLVPLVIWLSSKDKVEGMHEHGKSIVNFQLSLILLGLLSIPAILLFGLGILFLIIICVASVVIPILNAIKASNGEPPSEFLTIQFIK